MWLERQQKDPFVINSVLKGFRSRSAFKILEINKKYSLFRPGLKLLDLGASPGGWSQVASKTINKNNSGKVYAIDIKNMEPMEGIIFLQTDVFKLDKEYLLKKTDGKVNVILSDMAPSSTGHKLTDQMRSEKLSLEAYFLAINLLDKNGDFCCKLLRGAGEKEFLNLVKKRFNKVNIFKPLSSRKESKEIFIVAKGFKSL